MADQQDTGILHQSSETSFDLNSTDDIEMFLDPPKASEFLDIQPPPRFNGSDALADQENGPEINDDQVAMNITSLEQRLEEKQTRRIAAERDLNEIRSNSTISINHWKNTAIDLCKQLEILRIKNEGSHHVNDDYLCLVASNLVSGISSLLPVSFVKTLSTNTGS
ncbi:hypothetical protein Hte_006546 [Hypoxylon texense]